MEKDLCASGIVILLFLVAMMALALLYSTLHGPKATLNSRLGLEKQFDH